KEGADERGLDRLRSPLGARERADSDRDRRRRNERAQAEARQKDVEKGAQALRRGPMPKPDDKGRKPAARTTPGAGPTGKPAPSPKEKPRPADVVVSDHADGGGDPVAAWHGRVVSKAGAVTAPPLTDAERYVVEYPAATATVR